MARTEAGTRLTAQHRQAQLALRAATLRDLVALWAVVDPLNLSGTIGPFTTAGALLVTARHRDSAGLAARYFLDFRAVEGVTGNAAPILADPLSDDVATNALRGAGLRGIIKARRAGFSPTAAARQGLVRVSGAAGSLVLNGGRRTIIASGAADPRAQRWLRVTAASPCHFCAMLASRGAVFATQRSADFETHDHCSCGVEVSYPGSTLPERSVEFNDLWNASTRGRSGAEARRAFRRAHEGRPAPGDPINQ